MLGPGIVVLVEVIGVVMTQEHKINRRQCIHFHSRVGPSSSYNAWTKVDMVAGVQEVRICQDSYVIPIQDSSCCTDEVQRADSC